MIRSECVHLRVIIHAQRGLSDIHVDSYRSGIYRLVDDAKFVRFRALAVRNSNPTIDPPGEQ